jgi:hypothetical protein
MTRRTQGLQKPEKHDSQLYSRAVPNMCTKGYNFLGNKSNIQESKGRPFNTSAEQFKRTTGKNMRGFRRNQPTEFATPDRHRINSNALQCSFWNFKPMQLVAVDLDSLSYGIDGKSP